MKLLLSLSILSLLFIKCKAGECCVDLRHELQESIASDWFFPLNGYKYKLTSGSYDWTGARHECQKMGADLATIGIRDFEIRRVIWQKLNAEGAWVGMTDAATEGQYTWIDNVVGTPQNIKWAAGEPNSNGGNEDCVNLWTDAGLNDDICYKLVKGICELKV